MEDGESIVGVTGCYDNKGEWRTWNELTYSYSYDDTELIILPYTVCVIKLFGHRFLNETTKSNNDV